jgi:esterase/lipase superfamily enzyme
MGMVRNVGLLVICLASLLVTGCQPKVYLMPSPVGLKPGAQLYDMSEGGKDDNLLYTLYATNRTPFDNSRKGNLYTIFPSDTLRLGFTVHRVGDERMSWEEILEESLSKNREGELLISKEYVREVAHYNIDDDLRQTSSQADGFFDQINQILERTFDKDILVYVHGANSNFYRATSQGAQFYHFTGHNSIVMTFSWPSAENILKYKTDVLHARQTIPAFARLVELLATHTRARNINILAYSAGAQVVAPGLAYLRDEYPDEKPADLKKRLRIGEVYLAAPDTAFQPFLERYIKFNDIVGRTTINLNKNDGVLRLSAFQTGVTRLGRPDPSELSEGEMEEMLEAMRSDDLDVLDVGGSEPLNLGNAHDSWYNHPWVSTDVLLLLLFNADPLERGLEEYWGEGVAKMYRFPVGYDTNLPMVLEKNRSRLEKKVKHKLGDHP